MERTKLQSLLQTFSRGRVIDAENFSEVDNWIVTNINAPAPVLALAAQNKAIALTIPTEAEWCVDILYFDGRMETLHNLWGQEDISEIIKYCIESQINITKRFSVRFKAIFCEGALNDAPNTAYWEHWGFFQNMERAQKRNYAVDDYLIKNVGATKSGILLELRMYGPGYRILFAYRKDMFPEILVGGFYKKGTGDDRKAQNKSIEDAKKRIDKYND
jgi:putative component of toxin-antitoxin plasmid stabilization module